MEADKSHFSTEGEVFSVQPRAPLVPRTCSPANVPTKQIRRKCSFVLRVDSSEEAPSSHASIFEAFYTSANNSDESNNRIEMTNIREFDSHHLKSGIRGNDENNKGQETSDIFFVDDDQFRYGHGTTLDTITEQKSYGTIRSVARTKSVDEMANFPFLSHRDSFVLSKSPRRKQSFSLNDLALIKSSYHDACSMIERETLKPLFINEVYAQPRTPVHEPLQRPPTPEGMPSWTASQNVPRPPRSPHHQPGTPNRLQRFFGLPASGITLLSRAPAPNVTVGNRSVSAPLGGRLAPRFRPPRSTYSPIDQHPFNNAPIAKMERPNLRPFSGEVQGYSRLKVLGKRSRGLRVRFTPSATARDSEHAALQAAIEFTAPSATHPMTASQTMPLYDPTISAKEKNCPHHKGRRASLAALKNNINHTTTPPSSAYTALSIGSSTRNSSLATSIQSPAVSPARPVSATSTRTDSMGIRDLESSCPVSVSSTTHLMSGAIMTPSSSPLILPHPPAVSHQPLPKTKSFWCWKCNIESFLDRLDHWWMQSASCLCFVCCGFDVDEDISTAGRNGERVPVYCTTLRGGESEDILGPRRVVLEEAPGVAL